MDETLDSLPFGNLTLSQSKNGYRYSLDPILLARFVSLKRWKKVVDLGTGSGVLPLVLARLSDAEELVGVELQESLAQRAEKNVKINDLDERVRILRGDVRAIGDLLPAGKADLVVSNPPYRSAGRGRVAPDDERAAARHELAGGLVEFVAAANRLLRYGGVFACVYLAERMSELLTELGGAGLEPKRVRLVHPYIDSGARLVMVEAKKGGKPGLVVEPPLVIYRRDGSGREYTDEVLKMYEMDA